MITESEKRTMKKWRESNKPYLKEYERKRYQNPLRREYLKRKDKERKELIRKILGVKCVICGIEKSDKVRVYYHEIHGKKHSTKPYYVLKNINDFVCLCYHCHMSVHWCMRYLDMNWREIKKQLEIKRQRTITYETLFWLLSD